MNSGSDSPRWCYTLFCAKATSDKQDRIVAAGWLIS
jgi:hypothetical protein